MSAMAFHEKAGRSQGNSGFIISSRFFFADKGSSHAVALRMMRKRFAPRFLALIQISKFHVSSFGTTQSHGFRSRLICSGENMILTTGLCVQKTERSYRM